MPIVVYQTISYSFLYAKASRMRCAHCDDPFTYINGDSAYEQVRGLPYVSLVAGHEGMRKSAMAAGKKTIRKFAKKTHRGHARCPHCHRYQPWMVRNSRINCITTGGICGALAGLAVLFTEAAPWWKWWAFGGAVAGAIAGFFMALREGPHSSTRDALSKTDDELQDFLSSCDDADNDPFTTWWTTAGKSSYDSGKTVVVSLGLEDSVGDFPIPAELTTSHVLSSKGFLGGGDVDPLNRRQEFRTRTRAEVVRADNGYEYIYNHVEIKGLAPVTRETRLGFAASVLDVTADRSNAEGEELPVVCRLERSQEPDTPCFFEQREVGAINRGAGWTKWVSVLGVIPETLIPPITGMRRYLVRLWALDLDQSYTFKHGRCTQGSPLGYWDCEFDWNYGGAGWQEQEPSDGDEENAAK